MKILKYLIIFSFALIALALIAPSNQALAFTCSTTTTQYGCYDQFDYAHIQGCTLYGPDCPSRACASTPGAPSQQACFACPLPASWQCPDSSCGSGTSCGDNTYYTCNNTTQGCDGPYVAPSSPSCTSTCPTCSQVGGTCNSYSCSANQTELNGVCGGNFVCCSPPTSTPTPTPTPSGCQSSADCGSCSQCCAGAPNYCSPTNFDCGYNPICGPTPTPPPTYGCTGANQSCVSNPTGIYQTPDCSGRCPTPPPAGGSCAYPNKWVCQSGCTATFGSAGWNCINPSTGTYCLGGYCQSQTCTPGATKIDCGSLNFCHY